MLPERYCQLLNAYLDGELSKRGRQAAVRLLRKSRQARAFFRALKQDSQRLRALPSPAAVPDLAPRVVRAIAERGLQPAAAASAPVPAGFPTWLGAALAASILAAVTAGSYYFFHSVEPGPEQPQLVKQHAQPEEPGLHVALRRLDSDAAERQQLAKELGKETAYHLGLTCQDGGQAVQRLRHAFKTQGIGLLVDKSAEDRLRTKKHGASYLLYADNIQPSELMEILKQMGAKVKGTVRQEEPFDAVVIGALTPAHRQKLARLLGVAVDKLRPAPKAKGPDLNDVLNLTTVEAKSAATESTAKGPRRPERLALVMACDADRPGPQVQDFLRHHHPPRPGTLQVVLVFHAART
jgi:hypothetical protein